MSAIEPKTTGWPPSTLMQDYSRQLSRWLSNTPGARRHADEAAADIAVVQPQAEPVAWISVAERLPESGAPVLVYATALYGGKRASVLRALYALPATLEVDHEHEDTGVYDEATDAYFCPEGWYQWNECEEIHWFFEGTVTHWQPLPAPPGEAA